MEKEIIQFHRSGLPVRISQLSMHKDGEYRGLHSHPAIEIIRVRSGCLSCHVSGERILLQANQTIIVNGNIGHALSSHDADIVYMQVDIGSYKDDSSLGEFAALYAFVSMARDKPYWVLPDDRELGAILQKIETRYYEDWEESRWYLKAYIHELVAFLIAHSFVTPMPNLKIEKIESIVCYIGENFKQPITLDEICAGVGRNKYALCHTFKEVTGQTVFAYINFLRIRAAVKMLTDRKYTLTEIAAQCGFSSAAYFNRVFKSVMGCAPSQYRKHF